MSNELKFIKTFTVEAFKREFAISKMGLCPSENAENGICIKMEFNDGTPRQFGAVSSNLTRGDVESGIFAMSMSLTQIGDGDLVWMLHKQASDKEIIFEL